MRRLLPRSYFARAVALVASSTAVSQAFGVLITPILTRLFTPEAFGVLAAYVAVLMTVKVIVGLRYEMAIPLADSDRNATIILLLTLCIVTVMTAVTTVAAMLLGGAFAQIERLAPLADVVWLLPLGIFVAGVYQTLNYWAIRIKAYSTIAGTTIAQGFGRGLVQLGAGFASAGTAGLVIGEIVGQGAGVLRLGRMTALSTKEHRSGLKPRELWGAAQQHIRFPLMMAPASLLNSAGMQLPTLLLATLYGPAVAGWYFATQRLLALPVHLLSNAMGQVFLGEAASLAKDDPLKLRQMFNSITRRLLMVGVIPTLGLVLLGEWGMVHLLGAEWRESGVYLQWLSISFLLKLSFDGLINLAIVQRQDYALAWAAIRLVMTCGAVLVAHLVGISATGCIAALAMAFSVGYLLKLWYWQHAITILVKAKQ